MKKILNGVLVDLVQSEIDAMAADLAREEREATNPARHDLTPRQFHWFTAKYGYDEVLDLVLAALKTNAPDVYADIMGDIKGATRFRFEVVAAVIENASVVRHLPNGVDLTADTMAARWLEAKEH